MCWCEGLAPKSEAAFLAKRPRLARAARAKDSKGSKGSTRNEKQEEFQDRLVEPVAQRLGEQKGN